MNSTDQPSPDVLSRGLEIAETLRVLSRFAASDLGARAVENLEPAENPEQLERLRAPVREMAAMLAETGVLVRSRDLEWSETVKRLRAKRHLSTGQILDLAALLEDFEQARLRIGDQTPDLLAALHRALAPPDPVDDGADAAIETARRLAGRARTVLDEHGEVRNDATPRLASLVTSVRSTRKGLHEAFSRYVRDHADVLGDDTVTGTQGRLAVLLPSGHRGRLPGLVHGRSASEKSYYFEPLELVEENNKLQQNLAEEGEERARILSELGREFASERDVVLRVADFVGRLDAWQAAARFGRDVEGVFPQLTAGGAWSVCGARHPLLDPRLAGLREVALGTRGHEEELVPLDLDAPDERVLVITGPNAGGKTVALKTLGVLSHLAACGWPVPMEEGSQLPFLRRWIAVLGDEQDVLARRSTFSAHLERLESVWAHADEETLVLLDEVAAGTNPEEGAALAIALLEHLVERGAYAVMTTHLLQLANAALDLDGCASLAMTFDANTGAPTYSIRVGVPGSSHALDLARRLGLSAAWIARAEALLGGEQMTLRHLIAETDALRRKIADQEAELQQRLENQQKIESRLQAELEQATAERKDARSRVKRELESFRRSARDELAREVRRTREQEKEAGARSARTASRTAARRATELVASSSLAESLQDDAAEPAQSSEASIEVGMTVKHRGLGWTGTVDSLRSGRAEVLVRGKRFRCQESELEPVAGKPKSRRKPKRAVTVPASATDMSMELMLVGERVEAGLDRLDGFLDQAVMANLEQVRVVHGHGTGRLKAAVREHLRSHPSVAQVEAAPMDRGGEGATIATMVR